MNGLFALKYFSYVFLNYLLYSIIVLIVGLISMYFSNLECINSNTGIAPCGLGSLFLSVTILIIISIIYYINSIFRIIKLLTKNHIYRATTIFVLTQVTCILVTPYLLYYLANRPGMYFPYVYFIPILWSLAISLIHLIWLIVYEMIEILEFKIHHK